MREFRALAVFVGVLGGIPAFGAIGIIAGPVVLSLVLALIEFAEESLSARKRLDVRGTPAKALVQFAPSWTYLTYSTV